MVVKSANWYVTVGSLEAISKASATAKVCFDGKISKRLNQIWTFECKFPNLSSAEKALITYGETVVASINDVQRFAGIIKRIENKENSKITWIWCESNAAILRDDSISDGNVYEYILTDSIIDDIIPTDWVYTSDNTSHYQNYKVTPGPLLSHITGLCKIEGWDWKCNKTSFGTWQLTTNEHLGTQVPVEKWIVNKGADTPGTTLYETPAVEVTVNTNVDKIFTTFAGVGVQPEVSRQTSYASACRLATYRTRLNDSEGLLNVNLSATATSFTITGGANYPAVSGTVKIDDETITYDSFDGTTFTCSSRTGATHGIYSPILNTAELNCETNPASFGFTAPGTIVIGEERIAFTGLTTTRFTGLTRGSAGTPAYAHGDGAFIFDGQYNEDSPETGSVVDTYGVRRARVEALGAVDQDGIDKVAQMAMILSATVKKYGEATLLTLDFASSSTDLGDEIYLRTADGVDTQYRLIGIDYDQFRPIKVYFGLADDYILENMADINSVSNIAAEKSQPAEMATIYATTIDGVQSNMIQVAYDDGTLGYVKYQ